MIDIGELFNNLQTGRDIFLCDKCKAKYERWFGRIASQPEK